jgi:penicillin-binding protein 1A
MTTLTNALAHSYNSVPVRLMIAIGRKAIIETAHLVGIRGELETWAPMVLGTSSLTLIDLTTGYATFATGGKLTTPYSILEMRRANGDVIYSRAADITEQPRQVVPEEKIAQLNSMLKEVVKAGTGKKADLGFAPQAGKTGTNQGYRDAWYIGFTAHNVTGVWFGNDDFSPMIKVTGGLVPAPTWKSIMLVAEAGERPESLPGIPYDDSYTATQVVASAADSAAVPDETDQPADQAGVGEVTASVAEPDDVSQVLKGMFNLFEDGTKPGKRKGKLKSAKTKPDMLVLPKANASAEPPAAEDQRTFLDSIFGSLDGSDKPRKKKPLFSF